ncbi:MAG TPA: hypothetical protein VL181_02795 [Holophagaceae bacterium]|jgi:hypothetical protein|nr:hypothetical protein [Holophagaceae bacterium]
MKTLLLCSAFALALCASGQSPKDESFVLTRAGSSAVTMSGDSADAGVARAALHGAQGLWFRREGVAYTVTDPDLVARARAFYKPLEDLGRQQGDLGKRQGQLGAEMGKLGAKMGVARGADMDELGKQMDELGKKMDGLGAQMDALGKRMDDASARADADMHRLLDEALSKGLAKRAD